MNICAGVVWWNERPDDIRRCVQGIANIADRILAVDGAYSRYPGATVTSDEDQYDAFKSAADEFNLELRIYRPDRLWAGQVEKRDFLMNAASKWSDWVAVVDVDHIIHTDRYAARAEIENASDVTDTIDVILDTPDNESAAPEQKGASNWHLRRDEKWFGHLFRSLPEFHVWGKHWWYKAVRDGQEIMLLGDNELNMRHGVRSRLTTPYVVEHLTLFRTPEQVRASRAFINDRIWVVDTTGQEDDRPDLPRPTWDFDTIRL